MSIEITIARAFRGDCIWIRYGVEHKTNIIIDSGPSTFKKKFRTLINMIKETGEKVDLLILTHIDDDHIKGFERYLADGNDHTIFDRVMFNSGLVLQDDLHSASNAVRLIDYLKESKVNVISPVHEGYEHVIGTGQIKLITPTFDAVRNVENYIETETGCNLHSIEDDFRSIDDLMTSDVYKKDNSITNKASIGFVLTYDNRNFAFLGDAHCEDIINGLKEQFEGSLDLIKLSHHGSSHNITRELLEVFEADKYIISTNKIVDKLTIARIASTMKQNRVYSNYNWWENDSYVKNHYFTDGDDEKYLRNGYLKLSVLTDEGNEIYDQEGEKICILKTL